MNEETGASATPSTNNASRTTAVDRNSLSASLHEADHARSVRDYPDIDFNDDEYVVIDVQRSIWGIVGIWFGALILFIILTALILIVHSTGMGASEDIVMGLEVLLLIFAIILPFTIGFVGTSVYQKNTFVVTNERVFSNIQTTIFANRNQNIKLSRIEDCSFTQSDPLQLMFNYGSIRLSTVGDEQTYEFNYVDDPKRQFRVVNQAVKGATDGEEAK